jgi:cellulose synthase/poly-beta-1,6-N-acetylglucosamine synthase-like glycosyltransferase
MILIIARIIIVFFAGITLLTHILIVAGIIRSRIAEKRRGQPTLEQDPAAPTISVIIPACNEEDTLPTLLQSLERQTYSNFELILINDRSTDRTPEIMEEWRSRNPEQTTIVTLKENPQTVNPKQFALVNGIARAGGDLLLFTDADCIVAKTWIETYTVQLSAPEIGIAFGPVHTRFGKGFLGTYQVFDHLFRYYYLVGSAGLGIGTGSFGNNLGVKRHALDTIGGYETLEYTPTEDAALISAVREQSSYRIAGLTMPDVTVTAAPQPTLQRLTYQQLRWSSGAFFSPDPGTVAGYSAVMLYLAGGVLATPFIPLYPLLGLIAVSTFTSMFMVAVSGAVLSKMPFIRYWLFIVPAILFSGLLYITVDLFALLKTPIIWKGKKLKRR